MVFCAALSLSFCQSIRRLVFFGFFFYYSAERRTIVSQAETDQKRGKEAKAEKDGG